MHIYPLTFNVKRHEYDNRCDRLAVVTEYVWILSHLLFSWVYSRDATHWNNVHWFIDQCILYMFLHRVRRLVDLWTEFHIGYKTEVIYKFFINEMYKAPYDIIVFMSSKQDCVFTILLLVNKAKMFKYLKLKIFCFIYFFLSLNAVSIFLTRIKIYWPTIDSLSWLKHVVISSLSKFSIYKKKGRTNLIKYKYPTQQFWYYSYRLVKIKVAS